MYLWKNNLDVAPQWKVMIAIYGVRSSGNQAGFGLRRSWLWVNGVVVSTYVFPGSDRGSNP